MNYVVKERVLGIEVMRSGRLGWNTTSGRLVIPNCNGAGQTIGVDQWTPKPARLDGQPGLRAWPGQRRWMYIPDRDALATDAPVVIAEAALDALAALSAGMPAVASPSAGTWREEWTSELRELGVQHALVCGDADPAGRSFNERVVASLTTVGIEARPVDLDPGRNSGRDLTDHFKAGHRVQ